MNLSLFEQEARSLRPLRFYQEHCIPEFRQGIRDKHFHSIGQAPCRFGKTVVSAHLIDNAMRKGRRCLFAAPRIALVEQTLASFEEQGMRHIGIMQANHHRTDASAQVQIACFDTLYRRDPGEFDLVILDEVHLCDARMWELKKRWKIVLGWTATPWSKGLGLHFSKLHVFATIPQMIGYNAIDRNLGLVPAFGIGPNADLMAGIENVKRGEDGEFQEGAACAFMDRDEVVADEVETWLRTRQEGNHPGDRTFHFVRRRASAAIRQEKFLAHGVKFEYIDGFTSERNPIFKRFHDRQIQGIISVGCLTTGVDADVRCIIDAAPSMSPITIVQKLMRGGTPAEGKDSYWINDHCGNANRFGWFEDIAYNHLDCTPPHVKGAAYDQEEQAQAEEKKRQECSTCRSILPRGALKCGKCGTQIVFDSTKVIKGDLVELRRTKAAEKEKKAEAKKQKAELDERRKFYQGMLWIADQKNFKPGWAAVRFKEKFGRGPGSLEAKARKPSPEILEAERQRYNEYRKAKAAQPQPEVEYQGEY